MAEGSRAINTGKSKPSKVPTPGIRPSFVLGSRPPTLRAPPVPRIKPGAPSTRQYGKADLSANPGGAGFTNVGDEMS
jgi:hypothetical protein